MVMPSNARATINMPKLCALAINSSDNSITPVRAINTWRRLKRDDSGAISRLATTANRPEIEIAWPAMPALACRSAAIGVSRLTGMNSEAISSATQSDIEPTALQVWRVATAAAREDGSVASELACMWGPCAKWNARRTPRRKRADAALDREPGVRRGCAAGSDALHRPASAATHDGRNAATDTAARACACLDVLQLTQAVNSDKDGGCARAYEALSSTTCLRRAPLPGADPQPL